MVEHTSSITITSTYETDGEGKPQYRNLLKIDLGVAEGRTLVFIGLNPSITGEYNCFTDPTIGRVLDFALDCNYRQEKKNEDGTPLTFRSIVMTNIHNAIGSDSKISTKRVKNLDDGYVSNLREILTDHEHYPEPFVICAWGAGLALKTLTGRLQLSLDLINERDFYRMDASRVWNEETRDGVIDHDPSNHRSEAAYSWSPSQPTLKTISAYDLPLHRVDLSALAYTPD